MASLGTQDEMLIEALMASPIATVVTNPRIQDNSVIAANATFSALTGYPSDEIVGRNCRFLAGSKTEPWLTDRVRLAISSLPPTLTELLKL